MKKLFVLCLFSFVIVLMVNAQQKTAKSPTFKAKPTAPKSAIKHSANEKRAHRNAIGSKSTSGAVADVYMKPVEPMKSETNPYQLKYGEKVSSINREIEKMKEELNTNQKISVEERTKKLKECEALRKK